MPPATGISVKIWDLPTRLFHWTLVLSCTVCWVSATQFDNAMQWHLYAGYVTLALILFRILWGFFGSSTARFASFTGDARSLLAYARTLAHKQPSHYPGHNPLGGAAVIALIVLTLLVSATGLFANDAVLTKGPLAHWVSDQASDRLSDLHGISFNVLLGMVALHVSAVLYYHFFKRENLIAAMLSGYKHMPEPTDHPYMASNLRAVAMLAVAVSAVTLIVWA